MIAVYEEKSKKLKIGRFIPVNVEKLENIKKQLFSKKIIDANFYRTNITGQDDNSIIIDTPWAFDRKKSGKVFSYLSKHPVSAQILNQIITENEVPRSSNISTLTELKHLLHGIDKLESINNLLKIPGYEVLLDSIMRSKLYDYSVFLKYYPLIDFKEIWSFHSETLEYSKSDSSQIDCPFSPSELTDAVEEASINAQILELSKKLTTR
jgi:hypothetical protein